MTSAHAGLSLYTIDPQYDLLPGAITLGGEGGGGSGAPSPSGSDVSLPAVKPPPWSPPSWPEDELRTRQPDLRAAQTQSVRRNVPAIDLAPLIYLRRRPYPPRDVADDDVLQKFDCGIV